MTPAVAPEPRRNDPCPCGSGKKYKKCCLGKAASASAPPPIAAWLHTASQYHQTGRLAEAEALYRDVLAQAPDHPQALHRLGLLAYQLGHLETAQELLNRAIEVDGTDASQHNDLGQIYQARGRLAEAVACYEQAIRIKPGSAAYNNLGLALDWQGKSDEAVTCFQQALAIDPHLAEPYNNLGNTYIKLRRYAAAIPHLQQALQIKPDSAEAHHNLGNAYFNLDQYERAVASYQRSLALGPGNARAHCHLGNTLYRQGRYQAAVDCYRAALAIDANYAEAHSNLGAALVDLQQADKAIPHFESALAIQPDLPLGHYNLGTAQIDLGQLDEAVANFLRALHTDPRLVWAHHNLGHTYLAQGKPEAAMACFDAAQEIAPEFAPAYNIALVTLNYLPSTRPAAVVSACRRYAEQFEAPLRPSWPMHTNSRDPERRLKVGYVSADFRLHSVAYFMEPLLAHHDRDAVEVYGYYNNTREDAVTARLQARVDHWLPCKGMADEELAARIQADGIDILVDLAGHTAGNRLLVFARKPAPVQVTYLGYPATTGLSAIDYRLVTADTDPPGAEAWHSERLYRLPRSLWCYRPAPAMPAVIAETAARRQGFITFGSMNNIAKVSEPAVVLWSRLLQAVPGSRLVLTNVAAGTAQRRIGERFAAQGIGPERLTVHGKLPAAEYYALLNTIDIALDPFPYTGTTTTCESLWMGVPVVTLIGETSVARSGYALLKGIGLEELAAGDEKEYVAIATALAQDLDRLDALRGGMRQRIASSPLRDEAGLTRDLEAAYRAMWRAWCARGAGE